MNFKQKKIQQLITSLLRQVEVLDQGSQDHD